jgi:hypothetical protein
MSDWALLDWDSAVEHPKIDGGFILVVEGVAAVPMDVELVATNPGTDAPDYLGWQVKGRPKSGEQPQVFTPWKIERDADGLRGPVGYALIGETKRLLFPPKEQ